MKGYVLIVLANGILFAVLGLMSLGNGLWIQNKGDACTSGNTTQCERDLSVGSTALDAAPYLMAFGAILLGLGGSLWLWHRWYRPPPPEPDEGPAYP